jgi:hypothetical protein
MSSAPLTGSAGCVCPPDAYMANCPVHSATARAEAQQRYLTTTREVARDCGYALAVHGSQARDLDLVAVPWTPEAVSAQQLVDTLCAVVGLVEKPSEWPVAPNPESKPWGRLAWALCGWPGVQYLDLSVAPRAGEPIPVTVWRTA